MSPSLLPGLNSALIDSGIPPWERWCVPVEIGWVAWNPFLAGLLSRIQDQNLASILLSNPAAQSVVTLLGTIFSGEDCSGRGSCQRRLASGFLASSQLPKRSRSASRAVAVSFP